LEVARVEWVRSHYVLSLGELRLLQDRVDEALALATEAVELATRLGETLAVSTAHQQLGEIHTRRGAHELADEHFAAALAALPAGLPERRAEVLAAHARAVEARR